MQQNTNWKISAILIKPYQFNGEHDFNHAKTGLLRGVTALGLFSPKSDRAIADKTSFKQLRDKITDINSKFNKNLKHRDKNQKYYIETYNLEIGIK